MFSIFFTNNLVTDFDSAKTSDTALFGKYFLAMLQKGVYLAPSQYESLFLSTALTNEHIQTVIQANYESLEEIMVKA
jgi:glutamate-1-semialdehyde 2,1-aminomutase